MLLAVLVLYSMTASTFQTSRCQHLREKCSTIPICESIWEQIENFCSIPGDSCAVKKTANCNLVIKFLVTTLPEFKDCNCTQDGCDIQMLLGKTCPSSQGYSEPSRAPDVQIKFPQLTKSKEVAHPGLFEKNCILAKDICKKDDACSLLYKRFQKICRAKESTYNCQTRGHQCFKAWQELKKTTLGDCKCPEPRHEKCTGIWKNIFNNSCLQQLPEYQALSPRKNTYANENPLNFDKATLSGFGASGQKSLKYIKNLTLLPTFVAVADEKNTEAEWKLSTLSNAEYKPQHSCLHVQVECFSDTVCNRQFSKYYRTCKPNETPSHPNQCKRALTNFYQNMPLNVAQKLTFCDCEELDDKCLHSKELLHGKPYTDLVQAPSCLSIIQTCQSDSLCWEKYKAFMSKCLNSISQLCLENNACMEYLDTKDFKCSDSIGCRKAYIDMWGILRPVECTCDIRSPAEQSSCKLFHQTLQSNSCFSQIAGRKAEHYPLLTDLPKMKSPATHKESLFVGGTLYIFIYSCCLLLIPGLILLALLKTRIFTKRAKPPSPAHLSERLMIPQQPWIVNCVGNDLPGSFQSQPLTSLP